MRPMQQRIMIKNLWDIPRFFRKETDMQHEQLKSLVAENCSQFTGDTTPGASFINCEKCAHWDGYCSINMFNLVESSLGLDRPEVNRFLNRR